MVVVSAARVGSESSTSIAPLISPTSYRAPTVRPGIIPREALVKGLLESGGFARAVVVCAPGGFGKTTTIALWSEADDRPFAWVHLDALDDNAVHLLQHVGLALDRLQPLDPGTARMLAGPGRPVETGLVPALAHEFRSREPFVLVLDDVHVLSSPPATRAVEGLLANLPPGSQLVLSGRSVASLLLARRRMDGELVELSAGDLTMSIEDAVRLLTSDGIELSTEELERLYDETEGWPGGLHLAALALGQNGRRAIATDRVSGRNRYIADYLMEEVLEGLPRPTVDFLTRSSVLDRMTAPMLDELLETDDAARTLEEIDQSGNLFLVPLDDNREWYRYHHLFGEMLRARQRAADPALAARLELRASRILEVHNDLDGAIRHALAGGDTQRATDLVLRDSHQLAFTGQLARLGRWLELLDGEPSAESVAVALARSWYAVAIADSDLLARGLTTLELHAGTGSLPDGPLSDGSPSAYVAAALIRAVVGAWGLEGVIRDTEIVRRAGRTENPWWGLATCIQGAACTLLGRRDDARTRLTEGLPSVVAPAFEAGALAQLALLDFYDGDLTEADRHASRGLAIVERDHLHALMPSGAVFAIGSLVAARRGRLDEAGKHAIATQRILAQLGDLSPRMALLCYSLLAQSALACGDPGLARGMAAEAQRARPGVPDATFLHAQLDQLTGQLDQGSVGGSLGLAPLTPAELRVLAYLPTHLSLQEIADQSFISRNTAKSHSVAIYRKLGVSSRHDAVSVARQMGLLES